MGRTATYLVAAALAALVCSCGSGRSLTSDSAARHGSATGAGATSSSSSTGSSSSAASTGSTSSSAAQPQGTPQAAARRFAAAYAQVLMGQRSASALPLSSSGVRAEMAGGVWHPPAALHARSMTVGTVTGSGNSWETQLVLVDDRGRQSASANVTVAATPQGWEVVSLNPPDFDQVLAPKSPVPPPSGPGAVRAAATAFTRTYLAFTYGQAKASAIRDVSGSLRRQLAASPPSVPGSVHSLHPRIAALALSRQGRGWTSSANVTDGQNTYQVIVTLAQQHGRWVAVSLQIN
jgi:hypothetical protein